MQRFLKQLQREIRTTFLFVTHDQEEAVTIADRICVMNHGRIEQIGSPQEVYYRPANEYVARFFGDNNLIDVAFGGASTAAALVNAAVGAFRCMADGVADAPEARDRASCSSAPRRSSSATPPRTANRIRVRVEEASFVGPVSQVRVRALAQPDVTLMVKLPSRASGLPARHRQRDGGLAGASANVTWSRHSAGRAGRNRARRSGSGSIGSRPRRSPMLCPPSSSCCRSPSF